MKPRGVAVPAGRPAGAAARRGSAAPITLPADAATEGAMVNDSYSRLWVALTVVMLLFLLALTIWATR